MNDNPKSSRREFLGKTAATVAGVSLFNAATTRVKAVTPHQGRVLGANDRINVAFIGNGMQFNVLLDRAFLNRKKTKNDIEFAAVSDVWQPRLDYAQKRTGAPKAYRDYREIIERKDIDAVVIVVPDHWHYKMAREALLAGKDVYLEKPMTYTVEQAASLNELVNKTGKMIQVGGSGVNTPLNWRVNDYIKAGKMGKILGGLISYNRNTDTGMWDYPIPGVGDDHWPDAEVSEKNLDWKMWLGPARKRPFSKERYFRWRKYWDYSGGNATDLLFHRLGAMSTMVGFDFPTRVVGAGGIYVQKNREVPDTYMTVVEYPGDYCINMISCMGNADSAPVSVFGNWGTLQIVPEPRPATTDAPPPQRRRGGQVAVIKAERQFEKQFREANGGQTEVTIQGEPAQDLVDNWFDCIRSREKPVYDVLKGYQVTVAINLGVQSYREGRALAFDPSQRKLLSRAPDRRVYLPADA
jgi:predicted dehydrogenase